jgi:hypothetical protein
MDYDKIREFVRQAHPKRRVLADDAADRSNSADGSEGDVDAGNFKLSTWTKFGGKPGSTRREGDDGMDSDQSNPREKFSPRPLTGGSKRAAEPGGPAASHPGAGKIALQRLELPTDGAAGDEKQDSLDLLVDEEHGIIGESDSGPDAPRTRRR